MSDTENQPEDFVRPLGVPMTAATVEELVRSIQAKLDKALARRSPDTTAATMAKIGEVANG